MPRRFAACDPCKASKLACDHARPVCARCQDKNRPNACTYRAHPFKKKRQVEVSSVLHQDGGPYVSSAYNVGSVTKSHNYPNPGYLGASSHVKIFDQIPQDVEFHGNHSAVPDHSYKQPKISVDDAYITYAANIIMAIYQFIDVPACVRMIEAWNIKGVNLALAGVFTQQCAKTVDNIFDGLSEDTKEAFSISKSLFMNSCMPIPSQQTSDVNQFAASFCSQNARWETVGLFFTAVSRATIDLATYDGLFESEEQRINLRRLAMRYSDSCIEIAISLDCLNDLQLFLQYENFILHSFVEGDQSYHSWRKLGDVASSIFALGYHEQIEDNVSAPPFLKELRWAAFARAYSGDKNVSIFLGRPPRILRKYCRLESSDGVSGTESSSSYASQKYLQWPANAKFDYMADTRWSFLCALLKEQILDLTHERNSLERTQKAECIQAKADENWLSLPSQFRLDREVSKCSQNAKERDFMVSARLNHLHVLFLLRLHLIRHVNDMDSGVVSIAAEILSLAVSAVVLRHQLVNSGTGIVWKVVYYGLPAAGILCLSLLNRLPRMQQDGTSITKVFQDLSVLVAEVDSSALIETRDPNYALLSGAVRTINVILERLTSNILSQLPVDRADQVLPYLSDGQDSVPWTIPGTWDFELDFWTDLVDHPVLLEDEGLSSSNS